MNDYIFSKHAQDVMQHRGLSETLLLQCVRAPDSMVAVSETEVHYFKFIGGEKKCLKVVINQQTKVIVTAYFDRNANKRGCK